MTVAVAEATGAVAEAERIVFDKNSAPEVTSGGEEIPSVDLYRPSEAIVAYIDLASPWALEVLQKK